MPHDKEKLKRLEVRRDKIAAVAADLQEKRQRIRKAIANTHSENFRSAQLELTKGGDLRPLNAAELRALAEEQTSGSRAVFLRSLAELLDREEEVSAQLNPVAEQLDEIRRLVTRLRDAVKDWGEATQRGTVHAPPVDAREQAENPVATMPEVSHQEPLSDATATAMQSNDRFPAPGSPDTLRQLAEHAVQASRGGAK